MPVVPVHRAPPIGAKLGVVERHRSFARSLSGREEVMPDDIEIA